MTKVIKIAPQVLSPQLLMLKQLDPNSLDSGFLSAVTRLDTVATFTIYLSQASVEMREKNQNLSNPCKTESKYFS